MWTRDGNLDSRRRALFQPNHFCLLAHGSFDNETKRKLLEQPKEQKKKKW